MTLDQLISTSTVMAIFRNHEPAQAVAMASKAWDLGIDLVEVPVQVPSALATLEAVVSAGAERGKSVGAGTVTTIDQLRDVYARSVAFTVAPGLDAAVVAESQTMGLPHLPGVSTPTEIQAATRLGCVWVKAFPASVLGTGWFQAMQGPFPNVSFVATGGIDADNANDYFTAGARMVAVGSALTDARQIELLAQLLSNGNRLRTSES
jgi:2-dehydro-3-deoxyphosphogluconate aldolase/(4S)-4-hydroxy-2-oxoglutarate aldolase